MNERNRFAVAVIAFLSVSCSGGGGREFSGETFASADQKEYVKIVDAERAEVQLANGERLLGTYMVEGGPNARFVVVFGNGNRRTYPFSNDGLLTSLDTGAELKHTR